MTRTGLVLIGMILVIITGCTTTQKAALGGAAIGAGAGAIVGHNSHYGTGRGAQVGGLIGGLTGALAGNACEYHQSDERMRRENAAWNYSRGCYASYEDLWD